MYATVPARTPWAVTVLEKSPGIVCSASPKSSTFTRTRGVTMMLPGLRSRWTSPCVVCGGQRTRDLCGVLDGGARREWRECDEVAERAPGDPLHDDEVDVAIAADLVHRHDVGMVEGRRGLGLAEEPLANISVRVVVEDYLDRDRAAQPIVSRLVHSSHRAGAQLRGDDVVAECASRRQQQ